MVGRLKVGDYVQHREVRGFNGVIPRGTVVRSADRDGFVMVHLGQRHSQHTEFAEDREDKWIRILRKDEIGGL